METRALIATGGPADTRKDQSRLTDTEWQALIDAINQLHGIGAARPAYRDFVKLHTEAMTTVRGMTWEVPHDARDGDGGP
jgi:hypothetical protein